MPVTSFFFSVFDSQDALSFLFAVYCKLKVTNWKAKVVPMDKAPSINLYSLLATTLYQHQLNRVTEFTHCFPIAIDLNILRCSR